MSEIEVTASASVVMPDGGTLRVVVPIGGTGDPRSLAVHALVAAQRAVIDAVQQWEPAAVLPGMGSYEPQPAFEQAPASLFAPPPRRPVGGGVAETQVGSRHAFG